MARWLVVPGNTRVMTVQRVRHPAVVDDPDVMTVLLGGDVMLGRGVDQILPHPGNTALREPFVHNARRYELAEQANGPIPRPVDWGWRWGTPRRSSRSLLPTCG